MNCEYTYFEIDNGKIVKCAGLSTYRLLWHLSRVFPYPVIISYIYVFIFICNMHWVLDFVCSLQDIDWVQTEKHVFETATNYPFLVGLHSCFQTPSRYSLFYAFLLLEHSAHFH